MKTHKEYQEAVDILFSEIQNYNLDKDEEEYTQAMEVFVEATNTIQELVDKEKPMKPKTHGNSKIGYCKCGIVLNLMNPYCSHCGQKIDWSDEE